MYKGCIKSVYYDGFTCLVVEVDRVFGAESVTWDPDPGAGELARPGKPAGVEEVGHARLVTGRKEEEGRKEEGGRKEEKGGRRKEMSF